MTHIQEAIARGRSFTSTMRRAPIEAARKARERVCMVDAKIRLAAMEPEKGAATAEYAMVLVAACGFAAVLFAVIKSDLVRTIIIGLIKGAMELKS